MKLTNLFESEKTDQISIKDVFYEKDNVKREGFKVFSKFISLAPNGESLEVWDDELKLEDLPINSLEGFPKKVKGNVDLSRLPVNSLNGIGEVEGEIYIQSLKINNFEGCGKTRGINVYYCNLENLRGLPDHLRSFVISHCDIKSFEGFPKFVEFFSLNGRTIQGIKFDLREILKHIKAAGEIKINASAIDNINKLPLLNFLKIQQLYNVKIEGDGVDQDLIKALEIINKHLPSGNIMDCQDELLEAGLLNYAKM